MRPTPTSACRCFVVPPDLVAQVGAHGAPAEREAATRTLAESAALVERRLLATRLIHQVEGGLASLAFLAPPKGENRTVYDARCTTALPGGRRRGEGDPHAAEATVEVAGELFGANGVEQRTVRAAWRVVGVLPRESRPCSAAVA